MDNLQIGTFGWQYESWKGDFYPDGMPEEWMLDYYSNGYRTVMVPQEDWLTWNEEQIEEINDAVEGDFSFYFEVLNECDDVKLKQLQNIVGELKERAAGVIVFTEKPVEDKSCLGLPITLVSKTQLINGWKWQIGDVVCSGAVCGVVPQLTEDAKEQTALLQSFVKALPDKILGAPLFIKTNPISMKQVYNLKTISELLGY